MKNPAPAGFFVVAWHLNPLRASVKLMCMPGAPHDPYIAERIIRFEVGIHNPFGNAHHELSGELIFDVNLMRPFKIFKNLPRPRTVEFKIKKF